MSRSLNQPKVNLARHVLPVSKGGTGTNDTSKLLASLKVLPASLKDAPNGVVSLDAQGKTPASTVSSSPVNLIGNSSVVVGLTLSLEISDYDSFKNYSISASAGSFVRNGSTITYTAPLSLQTVTLTVNGRQYSISVVGPSPAQPSLTLPADGATGIGDAPLLQASAFQALGDSSTHQSSDWQLATDPSFTNIVSQTTLDTTNLTSWVSGALSPSTTYYARVRYRGSNGNYSLYSNILTFTTRANFLPTAEEAKLTTGDKYANDYMGAGANGSYGNNMAISADGLRIVVGTPNKNYDPTSSNWQQVGAVYVFVRNPQTNVWTQEYKFARNDASPVTPAVNVGTADITDFLGCSVAIDSTGTRILAGSYGDEPGSVASCGSAYVFVRNTTTNVWTQEAQLSASDKAASDNFGWAVSMTPDATRAVVSAWQADISGVLNCGAVYTFTRSGTTWTQEAKVVANDRAADNGFGSSVSISADGLRMVVGAYNNDEGGQANSGAAYIFLRSGSSWSQEAKLIATSPVYAGLMGMAVSIDSTGTRALIGNPAIGAGVQGRVYVFTRNTSNNTWSQEANLVASDGANNDSFGLSLAINAAGTVIVVGAPNVTSTVSQAGGVYIFTRSGTTWTQSNKITASDKAATDRFGQSVTMTSSGSRIAAASPYADPTGVSNCGAAYVYS